MNSISVNSLDRVFSDLTLSENENKDPLSNRVNPSQLDSLKQEKTSQNSEIEKVERFLSSKKICYIKSLEDPWVDLKLPSAPVISVKNIFDALACLLPHHEVRGFFSDQDHSVHLHIKAEKKKGDSPTHVFSLPSSEEWSLKLKKLKKTSDPSSFLLLNDGSRYEEKEFVADPLFASTLEKYQVFECLKEKVQNSAFLARYESFLSIYETFNDESWTALYREDPLDLAHLSLWAFLNRKISQEELFVCHLIASAFLELEDACQTFVVSEKNCDSFLQKTRYLSSGKELSIEGKEKIFSGSLIQRTALRYRSQIYSKGCWEKEKDHFLLKTLNEGVSLDDFLTLAPEYNELESRLCGEAGLGIGARISQMGSYGIDWDLDDFSLDLTLLSPSTLKTVYGEVLPYPETAPSFHTEFFGYRRRFKDLFEGRPISYASPLFYLPKVHDLCLAQAGITAHDWLFHIPLEQTTPYSHFWIEAGKELLKQMNADNRKEFHSLALNLLDRAVSADMIEPFLLSLLSVKSNAKTAYKIYKYAFPSEFILRYPDYGILLERELKD